jgi:hypothetical protein
MIQGMPPSGWKPASLTDLRIPPEFATLHGICSNHPERHVTHGIVLSGISALILRRQHLDCGLAKGCTLFAWYRSSSSFGLSGPVLANPFRPPSGSPYYFRSRTRFSCGWHGGSSYVPLPQAGPSELEDMLPVFLSCLVVASFH